MENRDDVERRTTEHGRVYTDFDDLYLPSVSTVIDELPEPEGLKYWKKKHDGSEGNKDWRDILQYKSNRGTLIHYNLLNEFSEDDIGGPNEENSTEELKLEGNWKRYQNELVFAEDAWKEIKVKRGIEKDRVVEVECFVTNTSVGYAGQFDLLYIDKDDDLTLCDLKTSKRVYDKHKMQLVAYANALNVEVDKLEVVRIHPDSKTWQISHDKNWNKSRGFHWAKFKNLRDNMDADREEFEEIVDEGIDDG